MNPQSPTPVSSDEAARLQALANQPPPDPRASLGLQVPTRQPLAAPSLQPAQPRPVPTTISPVVQPLPTPVIDQLVTPVPAPQPAAPPTAQSRSMDIISPQPKPPTHSFPAYTQPISPVMSASPATPTSSVSYQPATTVTPANAMVERIDERPQQNSSDIEGLITREHRLKRLKGFVSLILFVGGVIVAAYLINSFVFQSYYVDGTSMTPTLQNDDRLIIDKIERTWANLQGKPYIPQRGQIIVLDSSIVGISGREEQLIKRVIGIPGDTVTIKDGTVIIKNKDNPDGFDIGKQLNLNLQPTFSASPIETTISDGEVYVMGDNRVENGSYDSRAFGPIESNKIVGRLWARILPLDKAQIY